MVLTLSIHLDYVKNIANLDAQVVEGRGSVEADER